MFKSQQFIIKKIFEIDEYKRYRFLEILPGFMVWSTLVFAVLFSFIKPLWVIYFILLFDFYWLVRVIYWLPYILISYFRYRKSLKINWLEKLKKEFPQWREIYHLIFLPTYKDNLQVLKSTFSSLVQSKYPKDRFIIVLACEERDRKNTQKLVEYILPRYQDKFFKFLVTWHPQNLPGEIPGKGSNTAWAGRKAKKLIDKLNIPYEKIIVSSFDIDTCPHSQYFACVTYTYLSQPDPTKASYQPLAVYNNNAWEAPAITRVVSQATTFWLMAEQLRPDRLFTFSSHSMSFKALVDVGFWQSDIVTEDSRIFLQCFMEYDGNYKVVPIHLPVSMDTVSGRNIWESLKNVYKQQRRWAFGVENFPWMVWNLGSNPKIPFRKKFKYIWNQLEGVYNWATAPLLILLLGRFPFWFAPLEVRTTLIYQNAPLILEKLMTAAMIGLVVCGILAVTILPPVPPYKFKGIKPLAWLIAFLEWFIFPICMILFGSLPATDAQTRLMLGKYLGFWSTKKYRKS